MQKRMVRKLDLEIALAEIRPHPSPKAYLEQYTITPEVAAEILYIAAYTNNDVTDKSIVDLGCGTGRLAIGGAILGAREAVGIDIDKSAVRVAHRCAERLGAKEKTNWVVADIDALRGTFDTVLQNPPFGVQQRKADRRFLEKALKMGKHIYSLHKGNRGKLEPATSPSKRNGQSVSATPSPFLKRFIAEHGGKVTAVHRMLMVIPRIFKFHRKQKHKFFVDLYIIEAHRNGRNRS